MAASTDARNIRVKVGGSWVDPSAYARVSGSWVRLDGGTVTTPTYPPLKIPQHTDVFTSTSYRSAPASEFRDSMGITLRGLGPTEPINQGRRDFVIGELQYLGIRHVRYTARTNSGGDLQLMRDLVAATVGTKKIKLLVEPGYLCNNPATIHGCTGVKTSGSFRTIDFIMDLFFDDPLIGPGIDIFELINEPNQVGPCSNFTTNQGPLTPGINGDFPRSECDPDWHDQYNLTWVQCLAEYAKKVWGYVQNDPRVQHVKTVSASPTKHWLIDSQVDATVPDNRDVKGQWGDYSQFCHYGADHPYCGFMHPGKILTYNTKHEWPGGNGASLPGAEGFPGIVRGQGFWPNKRGMITEFGYNVQGDPGVGQGWAQLPDYETLGNYMLRTYLEAFIRGHERFYYFNSLNEADGPLPRGGPGPPDDFTLYTWNGNGSYNSVTNWNIRTRAVEMMHQMTTTVGDGDLQPNIPWSVPNPHSSLRWLMLRNSTRHVMFVWRHVTFLQQTGVALDDHRGADSFGPPNKVTVAPITARISLPTATSVVETHPVDGAANTTLTLNTTGGTLGVDVRVAEKPLLLTIDAGATPPPTLFAPGIVTGA